jgi:hypothetical protein
MQFIFCIVQYYQLHSNNFLDLKDAIFVDVKQDDECMFFFFQLRKLMKKEESFTITSQVIHSYSVNLFLEMDTFLQNLSKSSRYVRNFQFESELKA